MVVVFLIAVGPNQTPPGMCLSAQRADGAYPQAGDLMAMAPCSQGRALNFQLLKGELKILSKVPVAAPVCLGAPPPPPIPPPGRPNHYYSCTAALAGGARLSFPFCNSSLPEDERLSDLVSRATCFEKAAALTSTGAAIPRLGVPILGAAEDTHGIVDGCIDPALLAADSNSTGCPTSFPNGPGMGATFHRALWTEIGQAMGREARGLNNMRVGPLYFLDPDINLLRDPRWGRAQEVPGECPYLTGEYGVNVIRGTQESTIDSRYIAAAGTMKHFQLYDLEGYQPNAKGTNLPPDASCDGQNESSPSNNCGRGTFDASPPARDFAGYYMAAWKQVAQRAAPAAIMCA